MNFCDFAFSGHEALQHVCATFNAHCEIIYVLILMDFDMPNLIGPETAKMINTLYD